ncbi:MAG: hypothetical protein WC485_02115 [Opitutaceae bacterium]
MAMPAHSRSLIRWLVPAVGLGWLSMGASASLAGDEVVTAVFSSVHNGYTRTRLPDGSFKPETYAFGEGVFGEGRMRDSSIDKLPFLELATALSRHLARQQYLPAKTPAAANLLIVVSWGTSIPYDEPGYQAGLADLQAASMPSAEGMPMGNTSGASSMLSMLNTLRDKANARNAALLGYSSELSRVSALHPFLGLLSRTTHYSDLISDLEEDRYYVILAAYDFPLAWEKKQLKLLWVTRVSLRMHRNGFDKRLDDMARSASRYFGQDSPGLVRQPVDHDSKIEIGEPKVIELPAR